MWRTCTVVCLHTPEKIDEAIADPKAHWENLEDKKAKERGVETRYQGQRTLGECVLEYGRGSAERKHCMANLARLCAVENLPLHIGSQSGFLKFMRKWEPRWTSISKQSETRLVECQSEQLRKDIKCWRRGPKTPQLLLSSYSRRLSLFLVTPWTPSAYALIPVGFLQ